MNEEDRLIKYRKDLIKQLEITTKQLQKICSHKKVDRVYEYSRSHEAYDIPVDTCKDCGMTRSGFAGTTDLSNEKWQK